MKRGLEIIFCLSFILVLSLSFVSAGFFNDVWDKITGRATSECIDYDVNLPPPAPYYEKNSVCIGDECSTDYCSSDTILKEAVCSALGVSFASYTCPGTCVDGACVESGGTTEPYSSESDDGAVTTPDSSTTDETTTDSSEDTTTPSYLAPPTTPSASVTSGSSGTDELIETGYGINLTETQLRDLQELNREKVVAQKELNEITSSTIPSVQAKMFSAQSSLTSKDSQIITKLNSYGLPETLQNELDEINDRTETWLANYNSISLKSDDYKRRLLGVIDDDLDSEGLAMTGSATQRPNPSLILPSSFDWRNQHGADYVGPVKSQGGCGSCWAFATIASFEGAARAYYNNPNLNIDLSEQDLVSCFLPNEGGMDDGCDGAFPFQIEKIFKTYAKNTGIVTELCLPYTAEGTSDHCNKCINAQDTLFGNLDYERFDLDLSILERVNIIKSALINYGPIVVGMKIHGDFFSYLGGIYENTIENHIGNHAVSIVGYGKENNREFWIVKNSWGRNWGENGYFRIFVGEVDIDDRYAFVAKEPFFPTERLCLDDDQDGYCNWGTGEKPATGCPSCSEVADCDDSNSSIFTGCGVVKVECENTDTSCGVNSCIDCTSLSGDANCIYSILGRRKRMNIPMSKVNVYICEENECVETLQSTDCDEQIREYRCSGSIKQSRKYSTCISGICGGEWSNYTDIIDCGSTPTSIEYKCTLFGNAQQRTHKDKGCSEGECYNDGWNKWVDTTTYNCCKPKDAGCVLDSQCCSSEPCKVLTCGYQTKGKTCLTSNDCASGLVCHGLKCISCKSTGKPCGLFCSKKTCCSGAKRRGKCT